MQDPKNRHLGAIAQLCWAISSQLKHVLTIGKKLVKQQYLPISSKYGELQPTNGWDPFRSLGHPSKFQRVSRLGSATAWHSSSGHQPNFAALNRERHLYSAGWPSRWALAHILVLPRFTKLLPPYFRAYMSKRGPVGYIRVRGIQIILQNTLLPWEAANSYTRHLKTSGVWFALWSFLPAHHAGHYTTATTHTPAAIDESLKLEPDDATTHNSSRRTFTTRNHPPPQCLSGDSAAWLSAAAASGGVCESAGRWWTLNVLVAIA